jgi:poly(3-hydroxybutyrate) depolymerase
MKSTAKIPLVVSFLTMSLVATSWAAPRSKLNHVCCPPPHTMDQMAGHGHQDHADTVPDGPRSKR